MHSSLSIRRVALGAALAGAAVVAVPTMASAASTCTFNPATKTMTVAHSGSTTSPLTLRNDAKITYRDGSGSPQECRSATGVAASAFNTAKINVRAPVNSAGFQTTAIDEHSSEFRQVSGARMKLIITTGTGDDNLQVLKGTGNDQVHLHTGGNLATGPTIDLDYDGTDDVFMTSAGSVSVDGGSGDDYLDASGAISYGVNLRGGKDQDTLIGGPGTDVLNGGLGSDTMVSSKDGVRDVVHGDDGFDDGFDTAYVDYFIDSFDGIENLNF